MEYGCSRKDMRILINPTPREDKRVARISAATSETVHVSPDIAVLIRATKL